MTECTASELCTHLRIQRRHRLGVLVARSGGRAQRRRLRVQSRGLCLVRALLGDRQRALRLDQLLRWATRENGWG